MEAEVKQVRFKPHSFFPFIGVHLPDLLHQEGPVRDPLHVLHAPSNISSEYCQLLIYTNKGSVRVCIQH